MLKKLLTAAAALANCCGFTAITSASQRARSAWGAAWQVRLANCLPRRSRALPATRAGWECDRGTLDDPRPDERPERSPPVSFDDPNDVRFRPDDDCPIFSQSLEDHIVAVTRGGLAPAGNANSPARSRPSSRVNQARTRKTSG